MTDAHCQARSDAKSGLGGGDPPGASFSNLNREEEGCSPMGADHYPDGVRV